MSAAPAATPANNAAGIPCEAGGGAEEIDCGRVVGVEVVDVGVTDNVEVGGEDVVTAGRTSCFSVSSKGKVPFVIRFPDSSSTSTSTWYIPAGNGEAPFRSSWNCRE